MDKYIFIQSLHHEQDRDKINVFLKWCTASVNSISLLQDWLQNSVCPTIYS